MENQKSNKEVLFGYSCTPSFGYDGEDDGGFLIEIYPDGKHIHKTYPSNAIRHNKKYSG